MPVGHGVQRRRVGRLADQRPRSDRGGRGAAPAGRSCATTWPSPRRGAGRSTWCRCWTTGASTPGPPHWTRRVARLARRPGGLRHSRLVGPRRTELIEALDERDMLPAIVFIFSRAACDDAVAQCLTDGMRLTSPEERAEIRRRCEEHTEGLPDEELRVLGYGPWSGGPRGRGGVAPRRADPRLPRGGGGLLRRRACCASCSPPRRCRSASTCRPARW